MNSKVLLIHILSAAFGLSSWIAINGLWVETPILVNVLPEQWKLASYITVITQIANVATIAYSLLRSIVSLENLERISIHTFFTIGTLALVFMLFFWKTITPIGNENHSVAFLILTFFLAMVDCTSSVLYVPFMSHVPSKFLVSHLIGQALSGLIPSFIALIQGVGGNPECVYQNSKKVPHYPEPRFSVDAFFILLILLVLISWMAFILLSNITKIFKIDLNYDDIDNNTDPVADASKYSSKIIILLLILEAVICSLTNGILPSIQPYSVLYHGNVTYHFVVTLAAISSPIGCLLTSIPIQWKRHLTLLISLLFAIGASIYIILSALSSPVPLVDDQFGKFLIVFVWIVNNASFAYSRTTITKILRDQTESNRLLFLGGVFTQLGSAFGAISMFYVVNYTETFVSYTPCK